MANVLRNLQGRLLRGMTVDFNLHTKSWEILYKPFLIKACWNWSSEYAPPSSLKGPEAPGLQTALGIEISWSEGTELVAAF